MPYNNTPIAPSKEVSGQVSLPLARVQKIINADPERLHTSKNAAFAIALATELFIQHFATSTHNVVKAETQKKPRRNVQYRDVATAVAKTDNLEFLVDVVPKTSLYKEVKERQAKKKAEEEKGEKGKETAPAEGSTGEKGNALERLMANGKKAAEVEKEKTEDTQAEGGAEAMDVDEKPETEEKAKETPTVEVEDSDAEQDEAAMQIEMEMRGPRANGNDAVSTPKATAPVLTSSAPAPATASAPTHRPTRSSGFTAINGSN